MAKSYRELIVWQRAVELSVALYELTRSFPREEIYGLTSQLRRAGVSAASNIAEGWGRGTRADYRNFLCVARGSALEVQTQLVIAGRLGYGQTRKLAQTEGLAIEVGKMLWTMVEKMGANKTSG
ncbi:MAG: four helix bundle protein [Acidobacteriaceae bacterium]